MTFAIITLVFLAFVQSVSFTLVSRARNRSNFTYHTIASIFSNGIWFLTFRTLVLADMNFALFIPYTIGTVCGSVYGAKISMMIEKFLDARSDSHLNDKPQPSSL